MNLKQLTIENYKEEVEKSSLPVLIDFYADWCGPCRMMAPIFEETSKEYKGKLKFLKLDTQEQQEIANKFEVMSIPTLIMLKDGKEVGRLSGYVPRDAFKEVIDGALKELE